MELFIIVALIYIGISYLLTPENADGLLAGYNTMSAERKKRYDIVSIVKVLNLTLRWNGICIGIIGVATVLLEWPIIIYPILLCGSIISLMVANVYTRIKFSTDPMHWYDWLLPIGIIIGTIIMTYILIANN
ncbi:MAG: DUF3784 domain-containing protein [Flavobacteriaceae bacterium]|jgi:hypothetical protein|nr:DUF3784 domain-containing protein [Flavobacteriaceae bacterium]